jgi:hypothetical protein
MPTEPGLYADKAEDLWLLTAAGKWHLLTQYETSLNAADVIRDARDIARPWNFLDDLAETSGPFTPVLSFA